MKHYPHKLIWPRAVARFHSDNAYWLQPASPVVQRSPRYSLVQDLQQRRHTILARRFRRIIHTKINEHITQQDTFRQSNMIGCYENHKRRLSETADNALPLSTITRIWLEYWRYGHAHYFIIQIGQRKLICAMKHNSKRDVNSTQTYTGMMRSGGLIVQ